MNITVEASDVGPESGWRASIAFYMANVLYCGDNLEILREYVPDGSVDLIYLDPPFNSQRTYNVVYKSSRAQEEAFKDYWSWQEAAVTYARLQGGDLPLKIKAILRSLHDLLVADDSDLLAYLTMMAPRLNAHFAHLDHPVRVNVIGRFAHLDRSEATQGSVLGLLVLPS